MEIFISSKLTVSILSFSIGATLLLDGCRKKQEKTTPQVGSITQSVYASGYIKSDNQYEVYSTVTGIISKKYVDENDSVKKGDPLLRITDRSAEIGSDNALLAAENARVAANSDKLLDAKNAIDQARIRYANDSSLFERQKNLWNKNIGTKAELDQRELAAENSRNNLSSARARYEDLAKQLRFNERQAKNNLAISRSRVGDLVIRSDVGGKVYSLEKEVGELVTPQMPLGLIGAAGSFIIELKIDEYDIVKLDTGQTALVTLDSYPGSVFKARITKIDPLMDDRTKTFAAEAVFTKEPPKLYPNLTVEANIVIQTKEDALLIPRDYLVNDSLVFTGPEKQKGVKVGLRDYQKAEILSGLSKDEVIYKPNQ